MARTQKQGRIVLDWFTVSYRSLFLSGFGLLVVGVLIVLYLTGFLSSVIDPRARASSAVVQAEEALSTVFTVANGSQFGQLREEAQTSLAQARADFEESKYGQAMENAAQSLTASQRLIALVKKGADVPDVQFYKLAGNVQVKRGRDLIWRNADEATSLQVGDQIKTDSTGSAQLIYFNGTITTIKPGTILELKELYDDPDTHVQKVHESLRAGALVSNTRQSGSEGSYHEVSTPTTRVTTKGRSEFQTRFDEINQNTTVGVYRGAATVRSGDSELRLEGRQRVSVDGNGAMGKAVQLPPTPRLVEPLDQRVFNMGRDGAAVKIRFRWETVEDEGTYHLQISSSSLFGELLLNRTDLRVNQVSLPPTPAGSYYWRLGFLASSGVESGFSETRKFKVIAGRILNAGDTVPPELIIDDFLVFSSQVIARGHTEPGAVLAANGASVDVGDDGSFTIIIQLRREGRNVIEFIAQDAAGNEAKVEKVAIGNTF